MRAASRPATPTDGEPGDEEQRQRDDEQRAPACAARAPPAHLSRPPGPAAGPDVRARVAAVACEPAPCEDVPHGTPPSPPAQRPGRRRCRRGGHPQGPRRAARCCSCTARSTTTGPSPRASRTPASTSPPPRSARCSRRPASRSGSAARCAPSCTPSAAAAPRRCTTGSATWSATTTSRRTRVNDEVDDLGWFRRARPRERLTYLDDIDLLEQYRERPQDDLALVVVRHAKAVKRRDWDGPDPQRPLTEVGERAGRRRWCPLLHAYGVARVLSSSSTRCVQTLAPYAEEQVLPLEELDELSEEGYDARGAPRAAGRA